jgi:putative MATE family efflux protein
MDGKGGIAMHRKTSKPLKNRLWKLAVPLFVENSFGMLIGIGGTIMIARYDNNAASAVGVAGMIVGFFHLLCMIVSVGAGILVAQLVGAKQWKSVSQATALSVAVNFALGLFGSIVLIVFAEPFLKLVGLKDDLLSSGILYIRLIALSTTFQAMSFSLSAVIRSYGYTSLGMKISIVPNVVNILLCFVLIYGLPLVGRPSLGVLGVGIAGMSAQIVGFLLFYLVVKSKIDRSLSVRLLRPFPKQMLRDIFSIGAPSTGENISYQISQIVIAGFITTVGVVALNTRTYYANIAMFIYLGTVAFTQASAVIVGNLIGEGRPDDAYAVTMYAFRLSMTSTVLVNGAYILLIVPLMRLFTDNQEILSLARWIVIVDFGVEIGRACGVVFSNMLKASGDVRFPMVLNVVVTWILIVPIAYVMGIRLGWGLIGIWAAFAVDEILRGILLYVRWHSRKWTTKAFVNREMIKAEA